MNGELSQRPGQALGAIVPEEQFPTPVDRSGVPAGEVANRRSGVARPYRRRFASSTPRGGKAA